MARLVTTFKGEPKSKGSLTAFVTHPGGCDREHCGHRAVATAKASSDARSWERHVSQHLQFEWKHPPIGVFRGKELTAVVVSLTFTFLKPVSAPKYRIYPTVKPDIDKLGRAVLDALSGIVYVDDRQVVEHHVYEQYGAEQGVEIVVWTKGELNATG